MCVIFLINGWTPLDIEAAYAELNIPNDEV